MPTKSNVTALPATVVVVVVVGAAVVVVAATVVVVAAVVVDATVVVGGVVVVEAVVVAMVGAVDVVALFAAVVCVGFTTAVFSVALAVVNVVDTSTVVDEAGTDDVVVDAIVTTGAGMDVEDDVTAFPTLSDESSSPQLLNSARSAPKTRMNTIVISAEKKSFTRSLVLSLRAAPSLDTQSSSGVKRSKN